MKPSFCLLTFLVGALISVHLAMNGKVGSILDNARVGNALFWCIGAATAVVIGLSGWQTTALAPLKGIHPLLLTAGIIGASLVFGIAWLIPRAGAGPVTIVMVTGQVAAGMLLSQFGWLGSPVEKVNITRLLGALIMLGGMALVTFSK
jgi:bacterial/archaeal transporter family-2 protein